MTDDELLTPRTPTSNDGLKSALLVQSTRRLAHTRLRLRATKAAACLICFGLGWATTSLRSAPVPEVVYVNVPAPVADAPGSPIPVQEVKVLSPAELELEAEQITVKAESARRFREAGDRYFRDFADYRAALRCYRNFLDEADKAELLVTPDDTWLLTSLKRAREQENAQ